MATKQEVATLRAQLDTLLAAIQKAPAATPATVPQWIADAKAAMPAPKPNGAAVAPAGPKPLKVEILTITWDPTSGREQFAPFRVLHVHNGASGKFYRGVRLDARYVAAVKAFAGSL